MRFHADLHVHSRYSRATSRDADLEHLALWAARKGITVVATGDFTHPASYLVPAHIWTPWFAVLGSKSGFDSIVDCYGDLSEHIFALETGLSSDPPMNWRLSMLDRYRLVSNSDAHSPPKLGRETTLFDGEIDYFAIRDALRTGEGYVGTVEFFPEEGKYHLDGHRRCGIRQTPQETIEHNGRCLVCGQPTTVGVLHRIDTLADRPEGSVVPPATAGEVHNLVPLPEILAELAGTGSKSVERSYDRLVNALGSELTILETVPVEDIARAESSLLAEAITRLRDGRVICNAGYDGEYGVITLFEERELRQHMKGGLLFDIPSVEANERLWRGRVRSLQPSPFLHAIQNELVKREEARAKRPVVVDTQLSLL